MFISFEGIEGSGKTTLLRGVAAQLRLDGRNVLETREPGGTPAGDRIRELFLEPALPVGAMTEVLLVNASRAQLVADVIRPALEAGSTVLCDRYVDSTLAYQGYARGVDLETVKRLCEAATGGLYPDLTFLVDVSLATSRDRVASRHGGSDRIDEQGLAFHDRVRDGFAALARLESRIVVLDGERAAEIVLEAAMAAIANFAA
jgi:dTMP kinase